MRVEGCGLRVEGLKLTSTVVVNRNAITSNGAFSLQKTLNPGDSKIFHKLVPADLKESMHIS